MQTQTPVIFHLSSNSSVSSQAVATQPPQQVMERGNPQESQLPVIAGSTSGETQVQVQATEAREFVNPQEAGPAARQTNGTARQAFRRVGNDCLSANLITFGGLLCGVCASTGSTQTTLVVAAGCTLSAGLACCLCCYGMGEICPNPE